MGGRQEVRRLGDQECPRVLLRGWRGSYRREKEKEKEGKGDDR